MVSLLALKLWLWKKDVYHAFCHIWAIQRQSFIAYHHEKSSGPFANLDYSKRFFNTLCKKVYKVNVCGHDFGMWAVSVDHLRSHAILWRLNERFGVNMIFEWYALLSNCSEFWTCPQWAPAFNSGLYEAALHVSVITLWGSVQPIMCH
jgi:hypothetical protein